MGKAALRVGDPVQCICSCKDCSPCPNGKVLLGAKSTFINGRQAALLGSTTTNCCGCCCPCPNKIIGGSATVFIEGRAAARVGDPVRCGKTNVGSPNTFIG